MGEAIPDNVDFGFIAGRLDSIQKDQADMRRRVIETNGKIEKLATRIGHVESRIGDIEQQINGVTERIDHVVDRISQLEHGMTEVLFRLRRMNGSSTGKP